MRISSDYRDLLKSLNAAGVRFLVVGGYAVMIHTEPRHTKDLDVWIDRSASNAEALVHALTRFGAPRKGITASDFTEPEVLHLTRRPRLIEADHGSPRGRQTQQAAAQATLTAVISQAS